MTLQIIMPGAFNNVIYLIRCSIQTNIEIEHAKRYHVQYSNNVVHKMTQNSKLRSNQNIMETNPGKVVVFLTKS